MTVPALLCLLALSAAYTWRLCATHAERDTTPCWIIEYPDGTTDHAPTYLDAQVAIWAAKQGQTRRCTIRHRT